MLLRKTGVLTTGGGAGGDVGGSVGGRVDRPEFTVNGTLSVGTGGSIQSNGGNM